MRALKSIFLIVAVILLGTTLLVYGFVFMASNSDDFKNFAERKVSEYLKAEVKVKKIQPLFFNEVALSGITIKRVSSVETSELIYVERLIFHYDFKNIFSGQFRNPSTMILDRPTITIEENDFPYKYFDEVKVSPAAIIMPAFNLRNGEIRLKLSSLEKEVLLSNVNGKLVAASGKRVAIDIRGNAEGLFTGKVHVHGMISPTEKKHDLWLELDTVQFSRDVPLPVDKISGKMRWINNSLILEDLGGSVHGWDASFSGAFKFEASKPEIILRAEIGGKNPLISFDVHMDMSREKLDGFIKTSGKKPIAFEGNISQVKKLFLINSLNFDGGYIGEGEFNLSSGEYQVSIEKGMERVVVASNLRGLEFSFFLQLNHIKIYGLDLVTQAHINLRSIPSRWQERRFKFMGEFETDYFILAHEPFDDLKGVFEVGMSGIKKIDASWGESFNLGGQITFKNGVPNSKLIATVKDFDLSRVQKMTSKTISKKMEGLLEGKLIIEGELEKPEIIGIFNVKNGRWGKFYYDYGILQFRGYPPYLPLYESKALKGRSTFYLRGALDLSLSNMIYGIRLETPEKMVVWRGWDVVTRAEEHGLALDRSSEQEGISLQVKAMDNSKASKDESPQTEKYMAAGAAIKF